MQKCQAVNKRDNVVCPNLAFSEEAVTLSTDSLSFWICVELCKEHLMEKSLLLLEEDIIPTPSVL